MNSRQTLLRLACISLLGLAAATSSSAETGATYDVHTFGAVGNGTTLNTQAIQAAIDKCSAVGGGKVVVPTGNYLTGSLLLKDGVTLSLAQGADLLGSLYPADYTNVDPFVDALGMARGQALIAALEARHVGLEGPGRVDGRGTALRTAEGKYTVRPFLIRWVRCDGVTVSGVELRNSGAWTMHFFQSKNVTVDGVTLHSRGLPNNDGIDIDSCANVRVSHCQVSTGDDSICLKTTSATPCENITVTGCRLSSSCAAIKLGTESLGDFSHIDIDHCQVTDTGEGGIKLFSEDGSILHNVTLSDITMDKVNVPIMIRLGARLKTFRPSDVKKAPGQLHDVSIRNVHATAARQIGILISGVPGHDIAGLTLENIDLQLPGGQTDTAPVTLAENVAQYPEIGMFGDAMPASGIYARHVNGITFKNVHISLAKPDARPPVVLDDVQNVTPADFDKQR